MEDEIQMNTSCKLFQTNGTYTSVRERIGERNAERTYTRHQAKRFHQEVYKPDICQIGGWGIPYRLLGTL